MAAHPLEYAFQVKKNNARLKKKVFTLTFDQFVFFVGDTDYMRKKGTSAKSLQMDRREDCTPECPRGWCDKHGYHNHNIQAITLRENVHKYHRSKRDYSQVPF